MSVRMWSILIWALVGASAVFWAFKLLARPGAEPSHSGAATGPALKADLTRLLGSEWPRAAAAIAASAPVTDSRLTLVGVISPPGGAGNVQGMALISVDGNPPMRYGIGDIVDGDRLLLSVSQRMAKLGPSGKEATLTLTIPLPFAPPGTSP